MVNMKATLENIRARYFDKCRTLLASWTYLLLVAAVFLPFILLVIILFSFVLSSVPSGLYKLTAFAAFAMTLIMSVTQIHKIKWALLAFLVSTPLLARLTEYYHPDFFGVTFTIESFLVLSLFFSSGIHVLRKGKVGKDIAAPLLTLFILYSLVSLVYNDSHLEEGINILYGGLFIPVLYYICLISHFESLKDIRLVVVSLIVVLLTSSLFSLIQPFISGEYVNYFVQRNPSVYYNPNIFAGVIILLLPFALFDLKNSRHPVRYIFGIFTITSTLLALVLTGSKGALIALLAQGLLLAYRNNLSLMAVKKYFGQHKVFLIILLASGTSLLMNISALMETVFRRFLDLGIDESGSSFSERMLGLKAALQIGLEHWFGVGLGNFRYVYEVSEYANSGEHNLETAHNLFANIFAESGILGLVLFITIMGLFLLRIAVGRKAVIANVENNNHLRNYLEASLIGYLLFSLIVGGEFLHKNSPTPMILFTTVLAIITINRRQHDQTVLSGNQINGRTS